LDAGALTVSIGVAAYPADANTALELAKRAGEALRKAEASGLSLAVSRI
jgi:GGDEF domain-containing protein